MRFSSSLLLALPVLALAEEQVPLLDKVKGFFNKAQSIVSSAVPTVSSPVDAGAAKVAELVVSPLSQENWRSVLAPGANPTAKGDGPDHWLVYITGGNKTCYGVCGNTTKAWNQAVARLSAQKTHPNLAILDCEEETVLCNAWSVGPPSIYYMLIPRATPADEPRPATDVHYILLNRTSIVPANITDLYTKKAYKDTPIYEGPFHPFDGIMQQYGLDIPVAYALFYMSKVPSWLPMVLISIFSRTIMSRKIQNRPQPGGAAPAAAPAAAQ